MRLYDLAEKYLQINDALFDSIDDEGCVAPDIAAELTGVEGAYREKLAACCRMIKNLESVSDSCEKEEKRLYLKRKTIENRVASVKAYMLESMQMLGEKKIIADELFTVAVQNNPPSVVLDNPDLVPHEFDVIQERKISLKSVLDSIKSGVDVPGARVTVGCHLRIR